MMIKKKEYEQEFDFSKTYSIEDHIIKSNTGQNGHPDMCFVELPGVEFRAGEQWFEEPGYIALLRGLREKVPYRTLF